MYEKRTELETIRFAEALTGRVPDSETLRCASTQQLMRDYAKLSDWQVEFFAEVGRDARECQEWVNSERVLRMIGFEIKCRL